MHTGAGTKNGGDINHDFAELVRVVCGLRVIGSALNGGAHLEADDPAEHPPLLIPRAGVLPSLEQRRALSGDGAVPHVARTQ